MHSNVIFILTVLTVLAVIKNSFAIQCWECSSDMYGRCADHFNTTNFSRSGLSYYTSVPGQPRIANCEQGASQFGQYGFSRHVCLKKVEYDRRLGRKTYTRQCHTLVGNERVGTCLNTYINNNDISVDFCEFCDTNECNGGGVPKSAFWMSLLPFTIALVLRR